MALIFRTHEDAPYDTEIVGVGVLAAKGVGGLSVEGAAETMPELQDEDGEPLKGAKLKEAAQVWAAARGITVDDVPAKRLAEVTESGGSLMQVPDILDASREAYRATYGWDSVEEAPAAPPVFAAADDDGKEDDQ